MSLSRKDHEGFSQPPPKFNNNNPKNEKESSQQKNLLEDMRNLIRRGAWVTVILDKIVKDADEKRALVFLENIKVLNGMERSYSKRSSLITRLLKEDQIPSPGDDEKDEKERKFCFIDFMKSLQGNQSALSGTRAGGGANTGSGAKRMASLFQVFQKQKNLLEKRSFEGDTSDDDDEEKENKPNKFLKVEIEKAIEIQKKEEEDEERLKKLRANAQILLPIEEELRVFREFLPPDCLLVVETQMDKGLDPVSYIHSVKRKEIKVAEIYRKEDSLSDKALGLKTIARYLEDMEREKQLRSNSIQTPLPIEEELHAFKMVLTPSLLEHIEDQMDEGLDPVSYIHSVKRKEKTVDEIYKEAGLLSQKARGLEIVSQYIYILLGIEEEEEEEEEEELD